MARPVPRISVKCPTCGSTFETLPNRIASGRGKFCSRSCSVTNQMRRHGHTTKFSQSRTYASWTTMVQRCQNPKATKYPAYGAVGITVCDEWSSFDAFLADMGERPEGKTLDRIDGSKGYSKENCRWATPYEQQANIKTQRIIVYKGESYHLNGLARLLGLHATTLKFRIERGWPEDEWALVPDFTRKKKVLLDKAPAPLFGGL